MDTPTDRDDVIDSRDVIKAIETLESERDGLTDEDAEPDVAIRDAAIVAFDADEERGGRLKALRALAEQGADYAADWQHGEALIRDSHFKDYARELAEDIGAIQRSVAWPYTCIDWEWAAKELQHDYTSIEFGEVTYWVRS
jgi:hypothetical protein